MRGEKLGWSRTALLFVLLVALSWQSFVVGSHIHPRTISSIGSVQTLGHPPANERQSPSTPDTCPICQEIANAGVYLSAVPVVLIQPTPVAAWYGAEAHRQSMYRQRAHHWRSRAPPYLSSLLI